MKHSFAALILVVFPFFSQAQLSIRPQLGFNSSTLTRNLDNAVFSDQLGFQFGVDVQLGGRFFIQPGIFWESAKNELKERIDGVQTEISISRIRVPVLFGYRLLTDATASLLDIRLFTGPNAAFSVDKEVKESPLIDKEDFKDAVYGWNFGVGIDVAIVFVDAGYTFGLSEVFEGMADDVRNNLFYVNAGVRLGF